MPHSPPSLLGLPASAGPADPAAHSHSCRGAGICLPATDGHDAGGRAAVHGGAAARLASACLTQRHATGHWPHVCTVKGRSSCWHGPRSNCCLFCCAQARPLPGRSAVQRFHSCRLPLAFCCWCCCQFAGRGHPLVHACPLSPGVVPHDCSWHLICLRSVFTPCVFTFHLRKYAGSAAAAW